MSNQEPISKPFQARTRLGRCVGLGCGLALALFALLGSPTTARSQLVLEILPSSPSTTPAGGTGSFEVDLTNPTASTVQVAGFQVELSVPSNSGVTFTAANTNTTSAAYIFGTYQSSPASFSNAAFPNTDFIASDVDFQSPGYASIAPGHTVGLEFVSYSVASNTPTGTVTVSTGPYSSGADSANPSNTITFTSTSHSINVTPAAVPEPSQILMAVFAGTLTMIVGLRSRRRAAKSPPPTAD